MSATASPAPKRPRAGTADGAYDWTVTFDDLASFRVVVDAVAATLQLATFKVKWIPEKEQYVFMADCADVGMICCVSARLYIDPRCVWVRSGAPEVDFCIDSKLLQTAIETNSAQHGALKLKGGSDRVHVELYEGDCDSSECVDEAVLKTLVDGEADTVIQPLTFATHVEINLQHLRELIKKARKWHAEKLTFCIASFKIGAVEWSKVEMCARGDADVFKRFHNPLHREADGSVRVVADGLREGAGPPRAQVTPIYEGSFPLERIDAFARILCAKKVVAYVKEGMPIMLAHPITGGTDQNDSHIRYLVAPVSDGE